MQVIGLIGYVDKYDLVINLAKTMNIMDKAILVVDATFDKKMKYVIPALNNIGAAYVTQYNNIDFALGFESMHAIENYYTEQSLNIGLYDYILIDIDSPKTYEFFRNRNFDKIYFFESTGVLSVNKNKDLMKAIKVYNQTEEKISLSKIVYKSYISRAAEEYFNKQIEEYHVEWKEPIYEISENEIDKMADIDSQFSGTIGFRRHTKIFTNTVCNLTAEIIGDISSKDVKNQLKRRKE